MKYGTREILRATDYESQLIIQKFKMAQQCRHCVVTGCSSTAVDVPSVCRMRAVVVYSLEY